MPMSRAAPGHSLQCERDMTRLRHLSALLIRWAALIGGPLVFQVPLVGWHDVQTDFDGPAVGGPSGVGDVVNALVGSHLQELGLIGRRRPDVDLLRDSDLREAELGERLMIPPGPESCSSSAVPAAISSGM